MHYEVIARDVCFFELLFCFVGNYFLLTSILNLQQITELRTAIVQGYKTLHQKFIGKKVERAQSYYKN